MRDNLDPQEPRVTPGRAQPSRVPQSRPMTDREVPLTGHQTPSAVQAWLDGELPEAAVRRGDTVRDVEFWLRIDREVSTRRQMKTPAHVHQQIMDALPHTTPRLITPWWRRPLEVTPVTAAAATAGLITAGFLLGAMLLHAR